MKNTYFVEKYYGITGGINNGLIVQTSKYGGSKEKTRY